MKNKRRRIGLLCFGIVSIMAMSFPIQSEGSCQLKTLYSLKDWVSHEEFIDTTFSKENTNFINSAQVLASVNVLGSFSNANRVSDQTLLGQQPLQLTYPSNVADPIHFSFMFGKTVRLFDATLEMSATTSDNLPVEKIVIINGTLVWKNGKAEVLGGKEIVRSKQQQLNLDFQGQEVDNIFVLFETKDEEEYTYLFNSFQIHHYQIEEHVAWVQTPIQNTDTRQIYTCLEGGTYLPDGSGGAWKKEADTIFTPSTKLLVTKTAVIESQYAAYDYGRGNTIPAYSSPNVIKDIDPYAKLIQGWTAIEDTGGYYRTFTSFGMAKEAWPWIMTTQDKGLLYKVWPIYWSQDPNQPNRISDSTDGPWCQHTTGRTATPCYKYAGHSGNPRYNSYDVIVQTYKDLYDPTVHHITSVIYTLIDLDSGQRQEIARNADPSTYFSLTDTGRWQLEAELQDELGNRANAYSKPFYIDTKPPQISFTPLAKEGWSNQQVELQISALDQHSGLDYWRYSISYDDGKTYTAYQNVQTASHSVLLNQNGIIKIKIEAYDKLGNKSFTLSPSYYLDFLSPVTSRTWIQDKAISTVFYDSTTGMQDKWANAKHQLTLASQPLIDKPDEFFSGISHVFAKLFDGNELLLSQTSQNQWEVDLSKFSKKGKQSLTLQACDKANNCAILQEVQWKLDPEPPILKAKLVPDQWTNQHVLIQLEATDELSGVAYLKDPSDKLVNQARLTYSVEENGVYPFMGEDMAGNVATLDVPVTNIDKIMPTATFESDSIMESTQDIHVMITPIDHESGVKQWRYKISYDQGQSFFYTSDYQEGDQPKEITLNYAGNCTLFVEVTDRAGNVATIQSSIYSIFRGDAQCSGLLSEVYAKNEPQNLYLRVRCIDCDPMREQTVKIYQDDVLIDERKVETLPDQTLTYSYHAPLDSVVFKAVVEYDVDSKAQNNELTLRVNAKNQQFQQTTLEELHFEGPTVFVATTKNGQVNFKEKLTLRSEINQSSYFAGQGIDSPVLVQYENECGEISNWTCKATTDIESFDSFAIFDQGALPARIQYESAGKYKVALLHQGNSLKLPMMWATLHEGLINNQPVFDNLQPTDQILQAGNKWYTDPLSKRGEYRYSLMSNKTAKNEWSWLFHRQFEITGMWLEEIRYHFVDPHDATTFSSELWKSDLDWFLSLDQKRPLYQIEQDKK